MKTFLVFGLFLVSISAPAFGSLAFTRKTSQIVLANSGDINDTQGQI